MTIAAHSLAMLADRGPLSPEVLGQACREAGLTTAKDPTAAVVGALSSGPIGRAVRLADGRFALVMSLLEGRWLTTAASAGVDGLTPRLDLDPLAGLVLRDGLPLASGGRVSSSGFGHGITGPPGWLPAGTNSRDAAEEEFGVDDPGDPGGPYDPDGTSVARGPLLGLRLCAGELQVTTLRLDDHAAARGEALVERVFAAAPKSISYRYSHSYSYDSDRKISRALLQVLHDDPDALRQPVAPLSALFPTKRVQPSAPYSYPAEPDPQPPRLMLDLPWYLYDELQTAAAISAAPVETWVVEQLITLLSWPLPRWPMVDEHQASTNVVRLQPGR